jgi:hypothetical protein
VGLALLGAGAVATLVQSERHSLFTHLISHNA